MGKYAIGNEFWTRMRESAARQGYSPTNVKVVYALDPGETTGRCKLFPNNAMELEQLETKDVVTGYDAIRSDILSMAELPDVVVCENYLVYSWKSDDHKWNSLHTPQLIGAIKVLCHQLQIPLVFQLAVQAKDFVKDEMLEKWGCYIPGMRHARDAQRHALYYRMLGLKKYTGRGAEHVDGPS
jgi:hypothetical protein